MVAAGPGFDLDESPLTRLASRRGRGGTPFLSEAEAMAGERLRVDFTRGNLTPSVSQRWDGEPRQAGSRAGARAGAGDLSDSAIDARRRVSDAMTVVGPELSGVLLDVCCFLKGLETVERERQWPARSAKLMLKAGLGMLSRHYGFASVAAPGGASRIRRWRDEDARPTIGGRS
ncbi:DUF6456 domain-containing protein [Aurantimonas sp. VKM B-3413]|nr:DUF6456 domain-containing protein [Aurantimonas sp. VKM B-3413]MCB8838856.1 DUF6456 domain-containing protein [Aurantimonas sp. VKM B-3413]